MSQLVVPKVLLGAVIPANAGIQERDNLTEDTLWIPAFAGMTIHHELVAANGCSKYFEISEVNNLLTRRVPESRYTPSVDTGHR